MEVPQNSDDSRSCLSVKTVQSRLGSIFSSSSSTTSPSSSSSPASTSFSSWRRRNDGAGQPKGEDAIQQQEKKYVHVPTHAASDFIKTTTTRKMRKANEIL